MPTNLYLIEQLDRQHRQQLLDQAARDRQLTQVSNIKQTRSHTMKRMKLIAAAILVTVTLVGAGARAVTAQHETVPAVASMCCFTKQ